MGTAAALHICLDRLFFPFVVLLGCSWTLDGTWTQMNKLWEDISTCIRGYRARTLLVDCQTCEVKLG